MKILKFTTSLFPDWLTHIRNSIPDRRVPGRCIYSMEQVVFSGLMLFLLRYRSLRSFCLEHKSNSNSIYNFNRYISILDIPSDDELRYCLQEVPSKNINNLLKKFHQKLDRKKILKTEKLFNNFDLVGLDGTGQLHSPNIRCDTCLQKVHSNGETQYYHGQLLASLTNLNGDYSLPLQFEPIQKNLKQTDFSKNDCELNAAKRLIPQIQSQFPKRKFCFLGDNLFAVESITLLIKQMQSHFILTAKEERNKEVFFMFNYLHERQQKFQFMDKNENIHDYQWVNGLPLKQYSKYEKPVLVNLLCYQQKNKAGDIIYKSSWITDFQITPENVQIIGKAARTRFVIENRNFNEQKNLGFQTEHNFGHYGNLPNVFFGLAQIAQFLSELFCMWKQGREDINTIGSKRRYFEKLAVVIAEIILPQDYGSLCYLKFNLNSS